MDSKTTPAVRVAWPQRTAAWRWWRANLVSGSELPGLLNEQPKGYAGPNAISREALRILNQGPPVEGQPDEPDTPTYAQSLGNRSEGPVLEEINRLTGLDFEPDCFERWIDGVKYGTSYDGVCEVYGDRITLEIKNVSKTYYEWIEQHQDVLPGFRASVKAGHFQIGESDQHLFAAYHQASERLYLIDNVQFDPELWARCQEVAARYYQTVVTKRQEFWNAL